MIEDFPATDPSSAWLHLSIEQWNRLLIRHPNMWFRLKKCYYLLESDPENAPKEFGSRSKSGIGCRSMFRYLWKYRMQIREAGFDFPHFLTR